MDYQFNQQHHMELIREVERQRLATLAMANRHETSTALQKLLYRAGRTFVNVGERLQEQSGEMNPAFEQN
jgi:hypothetical protein